MNPQWQYNHLAIPLVLGVLISIILLTLAVRRRGNPLALPFFAFIFCVFILALNSLLEILTLNLELSLFFADLSFLGVTFLAVTWLGVVMTYAGKTKRFMRRLPLIVLIPTLTNIVIWTNPLHHLWRSDSYRDLTTTWFPVSVYNYGPWYYTIHMGYNYLITVISLYMLWMAFTIKGRVYRSQISILASAFLLPYAIEMMNIFGIQPIPHYNSSTLFLPISGAIIAWGFLRYDLLELTPIARDLVVESMRDLMLVLDNQNRIIDINPAAREKLFGGSTRIVGMNLDRLIEHQDNLLSSLQNNHTNHSEVQLESGANEQVYETHFSPITDSSGNTAGQLLILRDITSRKQAEKAFYEQVQQVAVLEERQRLARELHDSVSQSLFAARTLADLLPRAIDKKPEKVSEYAFNIQQLIQGTTAEMRLVLLELYPDALTETELGIIIKHLCDAHTGATGIEVEFKAASQILLESAQQIVFYRITQEALNNIRKHTQATQVKVHLTKSDNIIELLIEDNGVGFDTTQIPTDHFGLKNMRERANSIDAKFEIRSEIDCGTSIKLVKEMS